MTTLIETIRRSVIGDKQTIGTPFGNKPLVYADYTASGRSLSFIEDYIRQQVLPYYANVHTEASFTGSQTAALREQARREILTAINGTEEDQVIFCGSGATVAINKLIDMLNLRLPQCESSQYHSPTEERPVVFIGPYEHHSNELPWRESSADVVVIPLDESGQIDLIVLEQNLQKYANRGLLIGSFSAASNVTGVKSDVHRVTALLKKHGALACWDYAAAAPYVSIDMNSAAPFDAVFISPHKFIGGPGSPGILAVKKSLVKNQVPVVVGGGTVLYVTPEDHRYIDDIERREEGGTPAIIESIRAGLVFKLQQEVGVDEIERRENDFVTRAMQRFKATPGLEIVGNTDAPRLSIVSLRFKYGALDVHYGFVVALLNDLFGIQVRGGCSCAGPYGHSLLGMDMRYSKAIEREVQRGNAVLRPGWVRLNFNYFIDDTEFEYLVQAIELVAEYGWRLLPYYHFDDKKGIWRYQRQGNQMPSSLQALRFAEHCAEQHSAPHATQTQSLQGQTESAKKVLLDERHDGKLCLYELHLSEEGERIRWFVLPQEITRELQASQQS